MIRKLSLFFILTYHIFGYSQEKTAFEGSRFGVAFSPGVIQQRNTFLESNLFMGIIFAEEGKKVPAVGVAGFRIGIESDLNKTIAPKFGVELALLAVTVRLSAANYYQDKNSEFRIIPEFGYCVGGWVNLTYGYGISLNGRNLTDIGHHRVAISFNLNRRLGKAAYALVKNPNK
jgi:hypothetical protein